MALKMNNRGHGSTLAGAGVRLCLRVPWFLLSIALTGCIDQPEKVTPTAIPVVLSSPTHGAAISTVTPSPEPGQVAFTATAAAVVREADSEPFSLTGNWIGGYQLSGGLAKEQMVSITFSGSLDHLEGRIETLLDGVGTQLGSVTVKGETLHFEWTPGDVGAGATIFDGQLTGHTIAGTVRSGGNAAPFTFVHSKEQAQEGEYTGFAGTYLFPSGKAIGFYDTPGSTSQVFATSLLYADLRTGQLGAAFPVTGTMFAVGSGVGLAYPFRGDATFERDASGLVSSLRWSEKGSPEATATRLKINTEEVSYRAQDGITLAGRLVSPGAPGKHPAVVIVHGAGKVTRQNWLTDLLGGLFAANGIATLTYDKRGVGDSGGVYEGGVATQENVELLGKDALAGVAYLKSRNDIDPAQIGMLGQSQAGWIIPFAASQSDDVAFMVLWSGPGVTQGISDLYDGIAEGTDRAEITRILLNTTPSGFDPIPYLEKTSAPGFWAFGSRDMTVPVPESIANLEKVKAAGQKDFTWHIYSGADHYLFEVGSPTGDDLRLSPGYPAGMLDQMTEWVAQHVHVK